MTKQINVKKKLISVIVNCHNGEMYLKDAIQSVINQNMLPEGGEDDDYYDEDEYYEEGDEYYDEDEYYEEEGEGPPGGDWARYEDLIEEGYSSEEAIKIMQDEY